MARYIDADALMRELGINDMDCGKCRWGQYGYCKRGADFTDACFAIENAPTADVVERKVGKWTKIGDHAYRCSVCNDVSCCMGDYCPDCGAEMRKDTEDA